MLIYSVLHSHIRYGALDEISNVQRFVHVKMDEYSSRRVLFSELAAPWLDAGDDEGSRRC